MTIEQIQLATCFTGQPMDGLAAVLFKRLNIYAWISGIYLKLNCWTSSPNCALGLPTKQALTL